MMSLVRGWFRQRLVNPIAFRLSKGPETEDVGLAFSVAEALKSPQNLLVVPDGRSGGLFLGASQFWAIRNRYPSAKISLLVPSSKAYIAREIPFVDEVISYEEFLFPLSSKLRDVVRQLRDRKFDIAFCFSSEDNFCSASLCYKSGASLRVGFHRDDFPFFNVRIVPHAKTCYELERLALILRTLSIPQVEEQVSWSVSREAAKRLRERYLVARKPTETFAALDISSTDKGPPFKQIQTIAEEAASLPDMRLLIFFNYTERKAANRLKEALGQKALLFQTDDLPKIVALLEACHQLIACNTDLFHLAVAMGLPVTGIFSAEEVPRWIPEDRGKIEIMERETLQGWNTRQIKSAVRKRLSETVSQKEVVASG